jgi:hypothetical protein
VSDSPELYGFKAVSNHGTFDTFPFLGHEGRFPIALWHDWLQSPAVTDAFDLPTPLDLPSGHHRLLVGPSTARPRPCPQG